MVIRQEVTAPSPNIVQHFFHSLFNTVMCYLEKFRILHFWIQTAQLPNCFVYFYTFHTGVRNCVSSYCLESKLTYNIQSHLQVWRHAKTMQRNVNHTSAGLVKCQLPIIYSAVPEKGYSLLQSLRISFCCYRCVFISFVLYLLLSLSLSGRF